MGTFLRNTLIFLTNNAVDEKGPKNSSWGSSPHSPPFWAAPETPYSECKVKDHHRCRPMPHWKDFPQSREGAGLILTVYRFNVHIAENKSAPSAPEVLYFFMLVYFLAKRAQNFGLFWSIFTILYANLRTFWCAFPGLNNAVVYKNGKISCM